MLDIDTLLGGIEGFERDVGKSAKSVLGHEISQAEAEEIFFHAPVILLGDAKHSATEHRLLIYGPTNAGRLLAGAFTIRAKRVRIISIRDMSRQERRHYAKAP